jgi:hypothetical protein
MRFKTWGEIDEKKALLKAPENVQHLFGRWKEFMSKQREADLKLLELIAHPEATSKQITTAARERGKAWRLACETQWRLHSMLKSKGYEKLAGIVADDLGGLRLKEPPKSVPLPYGVKSKSEMGL